MISRSLPVADYWIDEDDVLPVLKKVITALFVSKIYIYRLKLEFVSLISIKR